MLALAILSAGGASVAFEVVIPRPCMVAIALTPGTECHGPDHKHLSCTGLVLTIKPGCESLRVR